MKIARPDLAALGLVALCVVAAVVLTALHAPVPDFLPFAGTAALGLAGGSYLPQPGTAAAAEPPAAAAPQQLVRAAAPVPALPYDPAATGVFRAATHAP